MNKFILVVVTLLITLSVNANETENHSVENRPVDHEILRINEPDEQSSEVTLQAEVVFDWINISQVERDQQIQKYKDTLFKKNIKKIKTKEFKNKYAEFLKDKNWQEHYRLAKLGVKETESANICAFFLKKDILLIYALQYKDNPKKVYYYNAYGSLQYIDEISDNYPNYPYTSKQYKKNGKLISAIYFTSHDTQYMYGPDGEFTGLWHKNKMFDRNGKQKITRTNW